MNSPKSGQVYGVVMFWIPQYTEKCFDSESGQHCISDHIIWGEDIKGTVSDSAACYANQVWSCNIVIKYNLYYV